MATETLTRERILESAEEVLRRYGPAKANVVDVARALRVSHGSVYRHFPSKAALRDAVTERWLESISEPLEAIAAGKRTAPRRLERWLDVGGEELGVVEGFPSLRLDEGVEPALEAIAAGK